MKVGLTILSGLVGEFAGWEPSRAWNRAIEMGREAERLGFWYAWVPDHLQVVHGDVGGPTLEAFTLLTAIAGETERIRLGPGVTCAAFRNPALLAKMAMTLDVASGGRVDLAIGAGWHEGEWRGYGYGYPSARERLAILEETLEVVTRMQKPGPTTWHGEHFHVDGAMAEPKGAGLSPIPIIVGGNGQNVTWRLAARFADELNLDGPEIAELHQWLPIVRQRCEEIGRDPETLAVSAEIWWDGATGSERVDRLREIADLGLTRIHSHFREAADSDEPLISFAEDCQAADIELDPVS